ncbi:NUDIX hydrolase [Desulfovibrio sp. X2]|uniref:NUDIX domain-containing protein n=1 Tax=Desulfovibrio sp. X2 TaxID=941449 RepID=UPI000358932D|nr:NUDIX hydrolase [Desulfovibrio sp. X2]EPR42415.1 NUDIX hydrolase [Desulfovibrio sp. X2]
MLKTFPCPHCGQDISLYANPLPTVDVVVYLPWRGVVLVERRNAPLGWALPGGFVDEGETVETAAVREASEETGLDVELSGILGVYSRPDRDPRHHTMSVVFTALPKTPGDPTGGDDASSAVYFPLDALPSPIVFDHAEILRDFAHTIAHANRYVLGTPSRR